MFNNARGGINAVHWGIVAYAMCFYVFLRSGFGRKGLGAASLLAWLGILLYAAAWESPAMLEFLQAFICMVIFRMVTYSKRDITEYQGFPWLASLCLLGNQNEKLLRFVEPFFVLAAGWYLMDYDPALGQFFTYGAYAMHIKFGIDAMLLRQMREATEDAKKLAMIYQQQLGRRS